MMDDSIDDHEEDHEEEEEDDDDDDDRIISGGGGGGSSQMFSSNNNSGAGSQDDSTTGGIVEMSQDDNGISMMDDSELEAIKARVREMEEEAEKLKALQSEVDRQMQIGSSSSSNNMTSSSHHHIHHHHNNTTAGSSSSSTNLLLNNSMSPGGGGGNNSGSTNSGTGGSAGAPLSNSGLFPSSLSIEEKMEVDGRSIYVGNVDYGATAEELEQHFHGCGSINRVTILCNKYDGHPKGFAYIEFADKESVNTAMALDESLFRGRQIKVMIKRTNRPGLCRTDRPPRGSPAPRIRGRGMRGGFGRGHRGYPRRASSIISSSGRMMSSTRGSSYYSPY